MDNAQQVVLVIAALGGFTTVLAGFFVTIFKAIKGNQNQLQEIHVLVNSNLTKLREELAAALDHIDLLRSQLDENGITPKAE